MISTIVTYIYIPALCIMILIMKNVDYQNCKMLLYNEMLATFMF